MPEANVDIAAVNIREVVKEKYGQAALRVTNKSGASSPKLAQEACCGPACCQ